MEHLINKKPGKEEKEHHGDPERKYDEEHDREVNFSRNDDDEEKGTEKKIGIIKEEPQTT